MNKLEAGKYFGDHYQESVFENITMTDTEYTHSKVDWHYHENPYFTYLLQGKLYECNKNEEYYLEQGDLLFHNWQDAHYNIRPPEYTRGFHIELKKDWFTSYDINTSDFEGSMRLKNPLIKNLMNQLYVEFKIGDQYSSFCIESLMLELFCTIKGNDEKVINNPLWVKQLKEMLYEGQLNHSLSYLSSALDIHPVHLSRGFKRYFGTSLGNYIRLLRVNKAFNLIILNKYSMTDICYKCGFYDQSHFISNFRRYYKTTPSKVFGKIRGC